MAQAKSGSAGGKKTGTGTGSGKKASSGARGGLSTKVQPDAQLAAVIGKEPVTRAEMTKKIWDYVKSNELQDAKDRRAINADAKLRPIFGKDQVSMFEMTKLVNQHVK
jgi:upstream activation factor subunit UAF30